MPELFEKQIGILLTSVLPGTPAAAAKLRAGDVIVRVNQDEVKSAEEFSTLLCDIGSGDLNMTRYAEMLINVGYPQRYCQVMGTKTAPLNARDKRAREGGINGIDGSQAEGSGDRSIPKYWSGRSVQCR